VLPWPRLSAGALRAWLLTAAAAPPATEVRFTALERVPRLVSELLDGAALTPASPARGRRPLAS